jgi:hypothetical protein
MQMRALLRKTTEVHIELKGLTLNLSLLLCYVLSGGENNASDDSCGPHTGSQMCFWELQSRYSLGTYLTGKTLGLTPKLMNQKLWVC